MATFPNGRALVIGVGNYRDTQWRTTVPIGDAHSVAEALLDQTGSAYPSDQVKVVCDPTLSTLTTELETLAHEVQEKDTVVLFFCGHGALGDDGLYYFATQDTQFTPDDTILAGSGLSGPKLLELLRAIKARKLLFIINACFSGNINPTLSGSAITARPPLRGATPGTRLNYEILGTGEGRSLITASRASQRSNYQVGAAQTYFGQALTEGLRGAVPSTDEYIGLYELYQYIYQKVKTLTATSYYPQEPVLTMLEQVGPFPVALTRQGAQATQLGAPNIQLTPPRSTAFETVTATVVRSINVQGNNNRVIGGSQIDLSGTTISGGVRIDDVAGGDIVKINISVPPTIVAQASGKQALLDLITKVQAEVDQLAQTQSVPKGKIQDAKDELGKARQAGEEGDGDRLREKLESAQKIILALSGAVPAAAQLAQTIGILLQRLTGLGL